MSALLRVEPPTLVGAAAGVILGIWVGLGVLVQALLVVQVADVVTGLIAGAVEGQLSSRKSFTGLARKSCQLILVLVVAWLSANLATYLGDGFPGADAVAGAFIVNELLSMLENAKRAGVDLGPLDRVLAVARQVQSPRSGEARG